MLRLKNHPFAVKAFFENSTVLTFSAPAAELEKFLPPRLELDTLNGEVGFIAAALVKTKNLRPAGMPAIFGRDFFLVGFRIFVRYTTTEGKKLRGLYILKSETNKKFMEILGNTFTRYHYTCTDISITEERTKTSFKSLNSGFHVDLDHTVKEPKLPPNSPFENWKEARRFAGPLPFTFTYHEKKDEMLIIQGVRTNWKPAAVEVSDYNFNFLNDLKIEGLRLANAFQINRIPYKWLKGKIDKW